MCVCAFHSIFSENALCYIVDLSWGAEEKITKKVRKFLFKRLRNTRNKSLKLPTDVQGKCSDTMQRVSAPIHPGPKVMWVTCPLPPVLDERSSAQHHGSSAVLQRTLHWLRRGLGRAVNIAEMINFTFNPSFWHALLSLKITFYDWAWLFISGF